MSDGPSIPIQELGLTQDDLGIQPESLGNHEVSTLHEPLEVKPSLLEQAQAQPEPISTKAAPEGGRMPPAPKGQEYDWGLIHKAVKRRYGAAAESLPAVDMGDGYPITLYHGTQKPITGFSRFGGEATRMGGVGVYFTANLVRAESVSDLIYTAHWLGDQPPRVLDGDVSPMPPDAADIVHEWAEGQLTAGNFNDFNPADVEWLMGKGKGSAIVVNGHPHPASLLEYNNYLDGSIGAAGILDTAQITALLSLNDALHQVGYDVVRHHEFPGKPPDYVFLDPEMVEPVAQGNVPLRSVRPSRPVAPVGFPSSSPE